MFEVGSDASYDRPPGARSALLFENADPAALNSYNLLDAAKSLGRLASWTQAKQAQMLAAFAYRRPPTGPYDEGFQASRISADSRSTRFPAHCH